jgi:hypothetical protein
VAEEAARLLDALGGWASTQGYAAHDGAGPAADPAAAAAAADAAAAAAAADDADDPGRDDPGRDDHAGEGATPHATGDQPGHCAHCGAANGAGTALTCQWCPVCQGLGLLRSVRPETLERLADLAGTLAVALRDVATRGRQGPGPRDGTGPGPDGGGSTGASRGANGGTRRPDRPATTSRGGRVQDITIEDEDQGSATV